MRVFVMAVLATIAVAIGFAVALNSLQKDAEMEFRTEGVRL